MAGLAAAMLAAGPATAESLSRGTISPGASDSAGPRSGGSSGIITHGDDPTGLHASDPFGYLHSDMNPVLQNQHPRSPGEVPAPSPQPLDNRAGNPSVWTPSWNADGSGYTVCRPLASFC
ncbi:hypothetical protein ACIRRA_19610 [Nocardia sp. NPDC101769]|uniref:hypothetical protein n=1 Tax=Nocardia sp. NPDC101769 TaxID=3364333 RepID=UPI0038208E13